MNTTRHLSVADGGAPGEQKPRRVNHYIKRAVQQTAARYEADHHDLHPQPKRQEREELPVELADAAKPRVTSSATRSATFAAGERPPLKFKGTVVVTAPPDDDELVGEVEASATVAPAVNEADESVTDASATKSVEAPRKASKRSAPSRHLTVTDTSGTGRRKSAAKKRHGTTVQPKAATSIGHHVTVASNEPSIEHLPATDEQGRRRTLLQRAGVIGMRRPRSVSTAHSTPSASLSSVEGMPEETAVAVHSLTGLSLVMLGIATILTVGLLGAEIRVVSTTSGSEIDYQFSIGQLINNLANLKAALFAHVGGS